MCSSTDSTVEPECQKVLVNRIRRRKRDKVGTYYVVPTTAVSSTATLSSSKETASVRPRTTKLPRKKSKALQKHGEDGKSGGMEALLPSFIGLVILGCAIMAKMGFRGRASVAGIDLGTTNSVICVQAPAKGVGKIDCIPDPLTNSSIIPSVVSFLDPAEIAKKSQADKKAESDLVPHPSHVIVGDAAKRRIDTHPRQTLYHAKRVLGRSSVEAMSELQREVEFAIRKESGDEIVFDVPVDTPDQSSISVSPKQVGSYVVNHLIQITSQFLGHDNVRAAVICVPAKFNAYQRQATAAAFADAGIKVTRVVEEPTAAALAYGLHKKENVNYILVYDFGGGTLDTSLLHVSDEYVEVMGSDGDDLLGGSDFDAAVAHSLLDQHGDDIQKVKSGLEALGIHEDGVLCPDGSTSGKVTPKLCTISTFHTIAEKLKIGLSSYPNGDGRVAANCQSPMTATNFDTIDDFCASLHDVELALTSVEFDQVVQPLYDRSVLPVRRLLKDLNVDHNEVDEVVMVGGTTRMPQIRRLVKEEMQVESLNTHIDPDITVAYGAASVID